MMRAVAPWNLPRVFVVDTSVLSDTADSVNGRTDVIIGGRKEQLEEIKTWTNKG